MNDQKKYISIVTHTYNEEENVPPLYDRITATMQGLPQFDYEIIFIDNSSEDSTAARVKEIAARDPHVRLIINARNFGHIRSPVHAIFQARGDAVIGMASDLQDPPELIPEFISRWEHGFKVVVAVKPTSDEGSLFSFLRRAYYAIFSRISDVKQIPQYTGFGLYDREVVDIIRAIDDPYPYFRGLVADIGFEYSAVPFNKPRRERGISKNNFFTLYDIAMLGVTSYSKIPLRLATIFGFLTAFLSLLIALGYFVAKVLWWKTFSIGIAPVVIGMFFLGAVQLIFIGILGEYIGAIHTRILKRPLVIEKERINF